MIPTRDPAEWSRALDEGRRMVRAWLDTNGGQWQYGQRPGDTPEGKAVLDSSPLLQVAAVHALLDVIVAPSANPVVAWSPSGQTEWQRRVKAKELIGALLRRKQPLLIEDVEALVSALTIGDDRLLLFGGAPEILRGLSLAVAPDHLTAGQRERLETLLNRLPHAHGARGERLKIARLVRDLLGLPAEEETAGAPSVELPPQLETDPRALRREASKRLEMFLGAVVAHSDNQKVLQAFAPENRGALRAFYTSGGPRSVVTDPRSFPSGQALLAAEMPLQLASWEVAIERLLPIEPGGAPMTANALHLQALQGLLAQLLDRSLATIVADVAGVLERLVAMPRIWQRIWYVQVALGRLLDSIEADGIAAELRPQIRALRESAAVHAGQPGVRELLVRLDRLLLIRPGPVEAVDDWGYAAHAALNALAEPLRTSWVKVLAHARDATGSKPSARWLKGAQPLIASLGADAHLDLTAAWLDLLKAGPAFALDAPENYYSFTPSAIPSETNAAILRGLVWLSTLGETRRIAPQLAMAAVRCYTKVPGTGPRAVAVGNACLYALGTLDPMEAVQHVQTVRHRVTYLPALKLVDAALENAARRSGMSKEDLEDLTIPTFGLEDGRRHEALGDYAAELVVSSGGVEVRWSKAGAPLRSEPAAARRVFPDEVKALKAIAEDIRKQLPIQRERLERALTVERIWSLDGWRERCFDHPLVSAFARRLIWCFETPAVQLGAWDGQQLVDEGGQPLDPLPPETRVRLWHPIGWQPSTVLAWRDWLERHDIVQPFKQAHREVYLLTDAELATRTYSNRFAAHLLRQHQMHALAQQRGWKAPLAMVYDGGWDVQLTLALPIWGLEAAYFLSAVLDVNEGGYNDNGVCLYVSTDQVCFRRAGEPDPLPLADVPALAFSEVMRDVDLFVGVASVGADPTWNDRGTVQQHAYWQGYAFGDLSESAKTRRAVLERLLPRLTKLAGRWQLSDRFLIVRGDRRTYKIHLGSGNILMEPNNQYLCIVPDRRTAGDGSAGVFLPFEGDALLSVILSKALLLADDRAIKDPTILRQIGVGVEDAVREP